MAFYGGEFAVTATPTPLSTHLGITADSMRKAKFLRLQSLTGAAAAVFIGEPDLTAGTNRCAELAVAGSVAEFHCNETSLDLSLIYVVGTAGAGNIVLVSYIC